MKFISTSSSRLLFTSCLVLLGLFSLFFSGEVSAQTLTVTVFTAANDCTGTSRSAYYANNQCVSATTASVKYGCNNTRAIINAYQNSGSCDGTSFDAYIALDTCAQISATSSWKFSCGAGALESIKITLGFIFVVSLLFL
jgi:hypothetical protein